MERKRLESAAAEYYQLRGLFALPLGLLPILAALGNWQWGPLRHAWVFLAGLLLIGAACLPVKRFYGEHYGRVTLSTRQHVRGAVAAIMGIPIVVGSSLLLRSRADWSLDLPVNATAASFALLMLAFCAATVGLKAHHVVVWGALLVAGLLPVWTGGDPSNVGLVLAGVATMVAGLLDHRLLVRTLGPPKAMSLEHGNAEA